MPFTPLHMGPGIFIKALLQGSFSLMVFGWAQIVMDLQPLFVMVTGAGHLHGFSHTYIGATLLALLAALSGKYLAEIGLTLIGLSRRDAPITIRWWVACVSAFIGTYSHVVLDSIMHSDVEPFAPFTQVNALLGMVSIAGLHQLCFYSAGVGALLYYAVRWYLNRGGSSG